MPDGGLKSVDHGAKVAPEQARATARHPGPAAAPTGFDAALIPQLAGNLAVQRLLRAGAIKAKLSISQPHDPDEQEADLVADRVMRMAEPGPIGAAPPTLQRKCAACAAGGATCPKCEEEERIRRKERPGHPSPATPDIHSQLTALRGGGQPLTPSARAFFEPRFGRDFSAVRIHSDTAAARSAQSIQARAFTLGQHIAFAPGEYAPETEVGRRLLGHELTHVLQQGGVKDADVSDHTGAAAVDSGIGPSRIQRQQGPSLNGAAANSGYQGGGGTSGGGGATGSWTPAPTPGVSGPSPAPPVGPAAGPASTPVAGPTGPAGPTTYGLRLPDIPLPGFYEQVPVPYIPFYILPFAPQRIVLSSTATLDYIPYLMASVGLNLFLNVGPGVLRNIELRATPTALRVGATAELHVPAYFGLQIPVAGALVGDGLVCDVGVPPVSFNVGLSGGVVGTGTASVLADYTNRLSFDVKINPLLLAISPLLAVTPERFSRRERLDLGGVLEFMLNLFASGSAGGRQFCLLSPVLKQWSTGKAMKLTSDLDLDFTGRSGSIVSGGVHADPIPIADVIKQVGYLTPFPPCPQVYPVLIPLIEGYRSIRPPSSPIAPPGTPPFAPPPASPPGLPAKPAGPSFTCPVPATKPKPKPSKGPFPIDWPWGLPTEGLLFPCSTSGPPIIYRGRTLTRSAPLRTGAEQRAVRTRCGLTGTPYEAHHVEPLFLGGPDAFPNVVPWPNASHRSEHTRLNDQPHLRGEVWDSPSGLITLSHWLIAHPYGLPYIVRWRK